MLPTLVIVVFLSMCIYVQNGNKDREKSSEKFNFLWRIPSMLSGLLSLMFKSKHSKKTFCVFLTTVVLTVDVTLVYMYLCHSASRQKGQDRHQLPPIRVTTKCLNSTDDDNVTKKYDSNYLYQSSIVSYKEEGKQITWKSKHSDTTDDYDITSKDKWACPWYLNFTPARLPVVASVYPLEGNFKEILDKSPQRSLMKYEWARLLSFKQFPKESPAFPIRLAQLGFYFTGYKDNVTCFSCSVEYGGWKEEDIPIHVHKRLNPACKFITGKDTLNIPIHDNNGPIDPNPEEDMCATGGSIYTDGGSVENQTSVEEKQQCDTKSAGSSSRKQNGAKHPEYADFAKRESTYKDWSYSHIVSPKLLTEAGFVYAGGAGGKGTWGVPGDELFADPGCRDANDPNYDSDTQGDYVVEKVEPLVTAEEFDKVVSPIILEYFHHGITKEVETSLEELNLSRMKERIMELAVSIAIDHKACHREMTSILISDLYGKVLKSKHIQMGFDNVLNTLNDLVIDSPEAPRIVGQFIARAVADDCLPPKYITSYKGSVDNPAKQESLEKAELLLSQKHGIVRLDNIWGTGGGIRPVKYLIKQMVLLLKEYLSSSDIKEATRCLQELEVPHFHHELVYEATVMMMEDGTERSAERIVKLLQSLSSECIVTPEQMSQGFKRVFKNLPDINLDVPNAYTIMERFGDMCKREDVMTEAVYRDLPRGGRKRFVSEGDGGKIKQATL